MGSRSTRWLAGLNALTCAVAVAALSVGREVQAAPPVAPQTVAAPIVQRPAPAPPQGERWALVVGVTRYRGRVHDTIGGARDALLIRDILVAHGWRADHVKVLTDDAATGTAVRAGLQWLASRSTPSSFTFFHYSGHTRRAGGHQYLWPVDNAYISDVDVAAALRTVQGNAWFDFAACHAAGFDEGLASPQRLVTASSQLPEKSYEFPPWQLSVWTGVLFDQAFRLRTADANRDGQVTMAEALAYGRHHVPVVTKDQPTFGYNVQHPYVAGSLPLGWTLAQPPTG